LSKPGTLVIRHSVIRKPGWRNPAGFLFALALHLSLPHSQKTFGDAKYAIALGCAKTAPFPTLRVGEGPFLYDLYSPEKI
jgi:hypothetical protein